MILLYWDYKYVSLYLAVHFFGGVEKYIRISVTPNYSFLKMPQQAKNLPQLFIGLSKPGPTRRPRLT